MVPVPSSVQRIPGQPPVVHYGTVPDAVVGSAYEYHLFAHCGIRVADFAGRTWRVDPAAGVPSFDWSGKRAEFVPARAALPVCA